MAQENIEFYKIRDFGEKFNATIDFIRYNFKMLIKIELLIAAPMGLVVAIFMSNMFKSMFSMAQNPDMNEVEAIGFLGTLGLNYILILLLSLLAGSLSLAGVMGFMRLRMNPEATISFSDVASQVFKKLGGLMLLIVLVYSISLVGFVFLLLPGIYLFVVLSLAIPSYLFEDISIGEAISKPFRLIKEKWWSTFGLLVIAQMIATISSYVFAIPFYALIFGEMITVMDTNPDPEDIMNIYTGWKSAASMGVMLIGAFITYMVPIIALSFQYFNLRERIEATGLKSQIDNFENIG